MCALFVLCRVGALSCHFSRHESPLRPILNTACTVARTRHSATGGTPVLIYSKRLKRELQQRTTRGY